MLIPERDMSHSPPHVTYVTTRSVTSGNVIHSYAEKIDKKFILFLQTKK